jgi:serine/threonine protein kinase
MGDVYRARDERLGRDVALKVLPTGLTNDRERVERFAQEAKSASALNHPHIVAIYEIGQGRPSSNVQPIVQPAGAKQQSPFAEEVHYIAMELVDGDTLRGFLAGNPSLTRRIEILAQTAEGLGKAHAAGIVHRDLKPDNVMVSNEGYAKVVDFGLAKLAEPAQGWNPLGADSPTMRALTQQGELIGTAGYMSPEQILGKAVDQRSDIFSFGCIVHEAVTGGKPFQGDSFVDTLHEVLHGTPSLIQHRDERIQHELQRIVGKCLVKDRENRYQSIRDVALDLRALGREIEVPRAGTRRPLIKRRWLAAAAIALAAIAVIVTLVVWRSRSRTAIASAPLPSHHGKMQRLTSNGRLGHLAVSPDGRFAAYTVDDDEKGSSVWLHQIATGSNVTVLAPAPKTWYAGLAFTPDSNYLIHTRYDGTIYGAASELPILGGTPSKLIGDVDSPVSVSPDGSQIVMTRNVLEKGESRVIVTSRDGSHERVVATLPLPRLCMSPVWSPDGRQIAVAHAENIYLVDVGQSTVKSVPMPGWHGSIYDLAWSSAGDALIFSAVDERSAGHSQLMRVDLALGAFTSLTDDSDDYAEPHIAGASIAAIQTKRQASLWSIVPGSTPEQVTRGLGTSDGLLGVAWTRDQRIIYSSTAAGSVDLWLANADGSEARQLTNSDMIDSNPTVTPDGTTIVYSARQGGAYAFWRMNLDGTQRRQIVAGATTDTYAVTPDSKRIVFATKDDAHHTTTLKIAALDGSTPATPIATTGVFLKSLRITPDGKTVVFSALEETAIKLFQVPLSGGPVTKLSTVRSGDADVSPDGKAVACSWDIQEMTAKLALIPIGGGAPRLFDLGGRLYRWTKDGKGIVFVKRDGKRENLYLLPLAGGSPKPLTSFAEGMIANYEWSPDGKRILLTHFLEVRDAVLMNAGV